MDKIEQDVEQLLRRCYVPDKVLEDMTPTEKGFILFWRAVITAWARGLVGERDEAIEQRGVALSSVHIELGDLRQRLADVERERDELKVRLPCGHRKIDWDDSYDECVFCKFKAMANDYDQLPHEVVECHDKIEQLQAERDAFAEGMKVNAEESKHWGQKYLEACAERDAAHVAGMREAMEIVRRNKDFKGYLHEIVADEIAEAIKAREGVSPTGPTKDKIEQDVAALLPCINKQNGEKVGCIAFGGHRDGCAYAYRYAVAAWARGLVESLHDENCDTRDVMMPGKPCNCYVSLRQENERLQAERDAAHVEIARLKGALDIELVRGMEAADAAHVAGMKEALEMARRIENVDDFERCYPSQYKKFMSATAERQYSTVDALSEAIADAIKARS